LIKLRTYYKVKKDKQIKFYQHTQNQQIKKMKLLPNLYSARALLAHTVCLTIALFSVNTMAQESPDGPFFGKRAAGKWIIGVKAGKIDANNPNIDDADALGVVLGYEFDKSIGNFGGTTSFELEYLTGDETTIDGLGTYEANVLNAFFTYRSAGTLYYKVKLGASYSEIDVNTPFSFTSFESDDISIAAGIGLGYRVGEYGQIEVEYSQDSGDNDLGTYGVSALLEF